MGFNFVVGLCQLAGNLLMHSPEEDAFWTFVALMDNYLRSYCAINSVQMEVDSVFFAKTLESNDPQLAGKLFVSFTVVHPCVILTALIARTWTRCCGILQTLVSSTVLIGIPVLSIVPGYYRDSLELFRMNTAVVFGMYSYLKVSVAAAWLQLLLSILGTSGAPFLFRIALVLLNCLRKQIMALTPKSSPGALAILLSISPQLLPTDPDQLISSAYSAKFKDDDMRKMRPKIEAQLRKESGYNRPTPVRDALKK
jgi:hypothetical protein